MAAGYAHITRKDHLPFHSPEKLLEIDERKSKRFKQADESKQNQLSHRKQRVTGRSISMNATKPK